MEINTSVASLESKKEHSNNFSFLYYSYLEHISITTLPANEENKKDPRCIYFDNDCVIMCEKDGFIDDIYAVRDLNNSDRFFIAFCFHSQPCGSTIGGMIVYFDKKYKYARKHIISKHLNYDPRNEKPSNNNTFLYNQSLIMSLKHRNMNNYNLEFMCFDYEDNAIDYATESTSLKGSNAKIINGRFLEFSNNLCEIRSQLQKTAVRGNNPYQNMCNAYLIVAPSNITPLTDDER